MYCLKNDQNQFFILYDDMSCDFSFLSFENHRFDLNLSLTVPTLFEEYDLYRPKESPELKQACLFESLEQIDKILTYYQVNVSDWIIINLNDISSQQEYGLEYKYFVHQQDIRIQKVLFYSHKFSNLFRGKSPILIFHNEKMAKAKMLELSLNLLNKYEEKLNQAILLIENAEPDVISLMSEESRQLLKKRMLKVLGLD